MRRNVIYSSTVSRRDMRRRRQRRRFGFAAPRVAFATGWVAAGALVMLAVEHFA
ncbi:MAG: hypothetical protein F2832_02890 [Actinobacteria bacterium]|nr:hypothetical protein [Actinomycetota bacterium]